MISLGEFKPSDQWQTHVNSIFYGIKGPEIHNHFQTYVSLDHRLAHALADDFGVDKSVAAQIAKVLAGGGDDGTSLAGDLGGGQRSLAAKKPERR